MTASYGSTAAGIIKAALGHMQDRAATYDNPKGERSMNSTVLAFAAVTGVLMTEEQGWLFMALLKAVRSQQGAFRADSYEDGAAYFSLAGEAAYKDRAPVDLPCNNPVRAFHSDPMPEPAAAMEDDSARMRIIGQCGEMAEEVYAAIDAADPFAGAPEWAQWKAQDYDGYWAWFEIEPFQDDCNQWIVLSGKSILGDKSPSKNHNWRDTLIQRKQP